LNTASPFTVHFNSFTPNAGASEGFTFFTIACGGVSKFDAGFLAPTSTGTTVPANSLTPNSTCAWELDFSDRVNGFDAGTGVFTELGFDVRTDGTFRTAALVAAVPEPTMLSLVGVALAGLGWSQRRRKHVSTLATREN
jgi:hypothetical protein